MTSSCTLGFQATRPATWAILCLLYVGELQSISEAYTTRGEIPAI